MVKVFSILLTLLAADIYSQPFKSIVIETTEADEPPTREGRDTYRIEYFRNKNGDFEASYFTKKGKRTLLSHQSIIKKQNADIFESWTRSDRRFFVLTDFQMDDEEIFSYIKEHQVKLNFVLKKPIQIRTDSFLYCQSQNMVVRTQIGGYKFSVIVKPTGKHFAFYFESGSLGSNKFNISDYLYYYQLLKNSLPEEFPNSDMFRGDFFRGIISHYLQTVECEDHFYKAFIKTHPERSSQQNRTKEGWDFKNYLKSQGKAE